MKNITGVGIVVMNGSDIFKLQSREVNMSSECPSCGSMNIDSFTRTVNKGGGGFFGGGGGGIFGSLTGGGGDGGTTEEVYYQCGDCGHEWK
jgi:predicted RNA-binding Zn-ribbon protein involved in translation (DUF1610 family)